MVDIVHISRASTTAADNLAVDGISDDEGWLPSTVNNFTRASWAILAGFYDDIGGVVTVGGTANAITLTTSTGVPAYATGLRLTFRAGADNSGSVTVNLDGLGAVTLGKVDQATGNFVALDTKDLIVNNYYDIIYNSSGGGGFRLLGKPGHMGNGALTLGGDLSIAGGLTISAGAVLTGTYTPTITNGTNIAASTPSVCPYFRLGNMVFALVTVEIDATAAAGTASAFDVSLPVSSNLANAYELTGLVGGTGGTANETFRATGNVTDNRATFTGASQFTAAHTVTGFISYQVI